MASISTPFRVIASMYGALNRQIVELDEQIEELETIIFAPVSGDLSRVISSKTTKTGKTSSKINLFERLDELKARRAFKREITEEIENLVCLSEQPIRPYICDIYLNGGTIAGIARKVGLSDSKFRHTVNEVIKDVIVPKCGKLYRMCEKDRYISLTFERKTETRISEIRKEHKKYLEDIAKETKKKNEKGE